LHTVMMVFRFFAPSALTIHSIARPAPRNSRTMRVKSQKTSGSAPKSGKTSPSRPMHIFPATERKQGSPIHDFSMPARFGTLSGRRRKRAWDQNLVRLFLNFNAGAWSLPIFLTRWTGFSAHYHQDHSTQQKFVIPRFLDRVT